MKSIMVKSVINKIQQAVKSYVKNHGLFSVVFTLIIVLVNFFLFGVYFRWEIDTNKPGLFFNPKLQPCNEVEITSLIEEYYQADIFGEIQRMESLFLDSENLTDIKAKNTIIEGYENFDFHYVRGLDNYYYVVYVYWEIRFSGIETAAPGIDTFFVVYDKDTDEYKLKKELVEEEQNYVDALKEHKNIRTLFQESDKKLETALKKDEKLNALYEYLLEVAYNK